MEDVLGLGRVKTLKNTNCRKIGNLVCQSDVCLGVSVDEGGLPEST
jgi:hypothetical protein